MCPLLMDIIASQLQFLEFTAEQLQLLKCFLCPNMMVHWPEVPLPQDVNEDILVLGHDGQLQQMVQEVPSDQLADPIYSLFNPPEGTDGEDLQYS